MIEIIYNNKDRHSDKSMPVRSMMKIPKNVTQVGESGEDKQGIKVYVDESVVKNVPKDSYGVLLGEVYQEDSDYIFVRGNMVVLKDTEEVRFDDDIWRNIYEKISENEEEGRIVGWFYSGDKELYALKKLHLDNFAGNNKLLLKFEEEALEPSVYMYDNDALIKQEVYYLYWGNKKIMKENGGKQRPEVVSPSKTFGDGNSSATGRNIATGRNNMPSQNKIPVSDRENLPKKFPWGSVAIIAALVGILGYMASNGQLNALRDAIMGADNKEVVDANGDYDFLNGGEVDVDIVGSGIIPTTGKDESATQESTEALTTGNDTTNASETQTTKTSEQQTTKPTEQETEASAQVDGTYYIVKEGQSLYDICREVYGDISRVKEIIEANNLENPNIIIPGQKIFIPN